MTTFVHDSRRDASSTIRGFVYQVDLTIRRWLALGENESLELECGEDIDLVATGISTGEEEERILEQVKSRTASVTLRSSAAVESVANFALHRERNPSLRLLFRFTTNASVGLEQGAAFPASQPGIVVWKRLRDRETGETDENEAANALRAFYGDLEQPTGVGEEAWLALRRLIDEVSDDQWLDFLTTFEWSTGNDDPSALDKAVRDDLVRFGYATDEGHAADHHRTLFVYVIRLLSRRGEKRLEYAEVATVLAAPADRDIDHRVAALFQRATRVESRVDAVETRVAGIESATASRLYAVDVTLCAMQAFLTSGDMPAVRLAQLANPATDPPPPATNRIKRAATVGEIGSLVSRGWLALQGDSGLGKSKLAELIAGDDAASIMWLRLTDVSPAGAAFALRRAFEVRTQAAPGSARSALFRDAFRSASPVRAVVLDDLPRVDGRDPLIEDLRILATEAHAADALVISTSIHRLPTDVALSLGAMFHEALAPDFTVDETRELLHATGASEEQARVLAAMVEMLGEGHAGLIAGIAQYLQSRNWVVTTDELRALLFGQHAASTRRELLNRLLTSIADEQTRQLLYRMMLAIGDLSLWEVRGLANAEPAIDRPDERLSQLEGFWVQVENDERIRIPPVVRLLRPDDLDEHVRRFCYGRLAMMRMRRGTLSPFDVLKVVTYFINAGAHHYAGLALAQAFMELERLGPIPDSGLSDWLMWPLPPEMPNGTKLLVRGTQIGMRLKWGKDIEYLLRDVETILDQTTHPFEQSVIFITSGKLLTSDPEKSWRALPLLRRAIAAHDAAKSTDAPVVPIPESLWIESILLAANSVSNEPQLQEWQVTIESFTPERRALLDNRDDLELTFMSIANNFLLSEHRKPADLQEWPQLVEVMNRLAAWSLRVSLPLFHAHATRITIVALGEYLHDLSAARTVATAAVDENTDDRGRGVIEATMGKQLNLQHRWAEAREWFARALSRSASRTPLHFQALLAGAKAEQEFSLTTSIAYLREALTGADANELLTMAERFSARAELAIALFLADERDAALDQWEEAGAMLLDIVPDDDRARGRIVLFLRHSWNFYFAATGLLAVMQLAPREQRVEAPMIGQFEGDLAPLGRELDELWRARVQVILGKVAQGRSRHAVAKEWGQHALDSIAGDADAPAALRDEAQRLADLP